MYVVVSCLYPISDHQTWHYDTDHSSTGRSYLVKGKCWGSPWGGTLLSATGNVGSLDGRMPRVLISAYILNQRLDSHGIRGTTTVPVLSVGTPKMGDGRWGLPDTSGLVLEHWEDLDGLADWCSGSLPWFLSSPWKDQSRSWEAGIRNTSSQILRWWV